MKTRYITILFAALLACSCYKDLSTEATTSIPEIVISSEEDVINVAYGHDIELTPDVAQEGRSESDFEYLWEMDLTVGKLADRIEIGTEKSLTYKVGNTPSSSPYYLTLTVTDKITGLQKMKDWKVYVSSSLGEGILVAHTKDGGKTSDVSLLACKPVTYGYASDTPLITHDLYSFANGSPIQGNINALLTAIVTDGAVYNTTRIMIGTNDHLIALNPLDYKEAERDASLFNSKESFFGTTALFNFGDYASGAIIGGKLFTIICNFDRAYTKTPISAKNAAAFTPNAIGYAKPDQGKMLFFHPEDHNFHYVAAFTAASGMSAISDPGLSYSLEGAQAVAGGCFASSVLGMILKLSNGSYHLVTFELSALDPKGVDYDLSSCTNLDKAQSFAFCDNTGVFYYATSDKIYSCILSGGKATAKALNWKPDSPDEKITNLTHYEQGWYGTSQNSFKDYPFVLPYHRLQIAITTYNEKTGEGKIYLRPFNVSTGMFTVKDNGVYGGFGQITAITTTTR